MPFIFPIKSISEANQSGYRSTVLRPIYGIGILSIVACITCFVFKVPNWIGVVFAIIAFIILVVAIFAYIYCLVKDRGALRSEWHSINQMAIEHGILGDSTAGIQPDHNNRVIVHPQNNAKKLGGGDE